MEGKKVLVIGASSGIGAAVAKAACTEGAEVVVVARRERKLMDQFISTNGTLVSFNAYPIKADVTSSDEMISMAKEANEHLEGFDLVVFCAGFARLLRLSDIQPDTMDNWQELYGTNVVGANLATAAVLPYMNPNGVIAYLSSRTVDDRLALLAPYTASKAALDQCIRTWRVEEPQHRFTRVVMGWTAPTEVANRLGPLMGEAFGRWSEQGAPGGTIDTTDAAGALVEHFSVVLDHPKINFPEMNLDMRYSGTPASYWGGLAEMMQGE